MGAMEDIRAARAGATDVLAYYAFKATAAVELYRPVTYLYFLAVGLSFTQIATLEVLYNLTTVLGEVPTGYVGHRIESMARATVLSAMVMVSGVTVTPFQLGTGTLADATSPLSALAVAGSVLVVGSVLLARAL